MSTTQVLKITMKFILCILLFLVFSVEGILHVPIAYTRPAGLQRVNGSDPFGGCPRTPVNCSTRICRCPGGTPTTGVLIDGVIPTIDPVSDMDSWSSELYTVNRNGQSSIVIGFDFTSSFTLRGVEMKLFSCVAWNIAASTINVYGSYAFPTFNPSFSSIGGSVAIDTIQDCSSLSTVTIPVQLTRRHFLYFIEMTFNGIPSAEWAPSIAEIQFSDETPTEPPTAEPTTSTTRPTTIEPTTEETEPMTTTQSPTTEQPTTEETSLPTVMPTDSTTTTTQDTSAPKPLTTVGDITASSNNVHGSTTENISDITTDRESVSTSTLTNRGTVLTVLVIVFAIVILILSAALVIVSVSLRVYFKRSTQPTTEVEYDDDVHGNSNVPEIEMKFNEAMRDTGKKDRPTTEVVME